MLEINSFPLNNMGPVSNLIVYCENILSHQAKKNKLNTGEEEDRDDNSWYSSDRQIRDE
tara:strand:+ start:137 stop:313 length:177 start_codon:yes stop_codon:yes gene_type:complete